MVVVGLGLNSFCCLLLRFLARVWLVWCSLSVGCTLHLCSSSLFVFCSLFDECFLPSSRPFLYSLKACFPSLRFLNSVACLSLSFRSLLFPFSLAAELPLVHSVKTSLLETRVLVVKNLSNRADVQAIGNTFRQFGKVGRFVRSVLWGWRWGGLIVFLLSFFTF